LRPRFTALASYLHFDSSPVAVIEDVLIDASTRLVSSLEIINKKAPTKEAGAK
jgi:hypothetical protein